MEALKRYEEMSTGKGKKKLLVISPQTKMKVATPPVFLLTATSHEKDMVKSKKSKELK